MNKEIRGFEQKDNIEEVEKLLNSSPKEIVERLSSFKDEKSLQDYLERVCENPAIVAQLSYWEKWLQEEQRNILEQIVQKKRKIYQGAENPESLPLRLEKRFNDEELKIICENLGAIQLTFGCSRGCPFCGFDAVPGVREHIPYVQLANLFKRYGDFLKKSRPFLYWASEPSDYRNYDYEEEKERTYRDVHQLAQLYAGYSPHITSANLNPEWIKFLTSQEEASHRISVFGLNEEKIDQILSSISSEEEKRLKLVGKGKKHFKGIGLSFYKREEEVSIGIGCINGLLLTPRGLYNVIQSQISEELPQGQYVIPFEGFSNQEIKKGENIKDVLRRFVVSYEATPPLTQRQRAIIISPNREKKVVVFDKRGTIVEIYDYDLIVKKIKHCVNVLITNQEQISVKDGIKIKIKLSPDTEILLIFFFLLKDGGIISININPNEIKNTIIPLMKKNLERPVNLFEVHKENDLLSISFGFSISTPEGFDRLKNLEAERIVCNGFLKSSEIDL